MRARNHLHADDRADLRRRGRPGVCRRFHRRHVAAEESRYVPAADFLPAGELDVGGFKGRVRRFEQRAKARAHVSYATELAREIVDSLYYSSGGTSSNEAVPIQRFQRDIQALANHAVMNGRGSTELYGRILCGLEPNTPLV